MIELESGKSTFERQGTYRSRPVATTSVAYARFPYLTGYREDLEAWNLTHA